MFRILAFVVPFFMSVAGCEKLSPETVIQQAEKAIQLRQFDHAMAGLRSLLREDPQNTRARWLLAESHLAIEDGPSAEKELRRSAELGVGEEAVMPMLAKALVMQGRADDVLGLSPQTQLSPAAQAELEASRAQAFIMKGEMQQAEAATARALRLAPDALYVRYVNAKVLFTSGKRDDAENELRSLTQQSPKFAQAWSLLGKLLGQKGQYAGAEEAYTNAIENRFYAAKDRIDRGFARLALRKLEEAGSDVDVLLKIAPEMHRVHLLSGLISFEKRELPAAREALQVAYGKDPAHLWGMLALATVDTLLGNYNQGRSLAEKAFAVAPQNASARKLVAGYALRDRKGSEAEQLIRPVAERFPDDLQAKQIWAGSLLIQGKTKEAAILAEQVAASLPGSADAQIWAGIALMAAERKSEAVGLLDKAARLSPESREANNLLVLGLIDNKSSDQALAAAEKFAADNPSDPEAHNLLALTHLARGNRDVAETALKAVLAIDPGNRAAVRTLVSLAMQGNDPQAARDYLDAGLQAKPTDGDFLIMRAELASVESSGNGPEIYLNRAIEAHPSSLRPRILLAQRFFDAGAMDGVLSAFAGTSTVSNRHALALQAAAAYRLGLMNDAKTWYEALAALEPNSADVQLQLLRVYSAVGDRYREQSTVEKLAAIAPDDGRVKLAQATLLARVGRIADAETLISKSGFSADDPRLLLARLAVVIASSRNAEAVQVARRLHAIEPDTRSAVALSRALVSVGDVAAGVSVLDAWLRTNPKDVSVMTELAGLFQQQRDDERYQAQLRRILEVDSDNLFALNNLAWALLATAPVDALNLARSAHVRAPDSAAVMDTLALAYAGNNDYENALRFASKAIDSDPTVAIFRLHRAEIRDAAGDGAGALSEVRDLLKDALPEDVRVKAEQLLAKLDR